MTNDYVKKYLIQKVFFFHNCHVGFHYIVTYGTWEVVFEW